MKAVLSPVGEVTTPVRIGDADHYAEDAVGRPRRLTPFDDDEYYEKSPGRCVQTTVDMSAT